MTEIEGIRCSGLLLVGSSFTRTLADHSPVAAERFEK